MLDLLTRAKNSREAALILQGKSELDRSYALLAIAKKLRESADLLLQENARDLTAARGANLSNALVDRLALGPTNIKSMAEACETIAAAPQVVGHIVEEHRRADGLLIQKQRIPIGVIGMIFESRPNVVIDGAALAIKSGNAILLKGGKEAQYSNRILARLVQEAIKPYLPENSVTLLETREEIKALLGLGDYVDLMVPRGGAELIRFVRENATMPVVAHDRGLCHVYLHFDADPEHARAIILNAKIQRPGVCNAMETLLVHQHYPKESLTELLQTLLAKGVEIHACEHTLSLLPGLFRASEDDFHTEWLDLKMSVKVVEDANAALKHIQIHGTHHTEAVLTRDPMVVELFLNGTDSSCLAINASTRFNDGGELGLGAELGISTSKLHAYGPMGAREMTSTRFIVRGDGHIRS